MVLISCNEGLHDAQLSWELRKSKPASPDAALAIAVELHAFMEMDPSLRSGYEAKINMVLATLTQPLMATASTSQEDMMLSLIPTIRQEIQKALPQTCQISSESHPCSTDGRSVCFNCPGPNRQSANINQSYRNSNNKNRSNNNQNNRYKINGNQQNDRYNNNRNTPTSNKTETTPNNNHVDIFNRTNQQSRACQTFFDCGRLGNMSRECRAPQQNQSNRQQNSNVNQNSRSYYQDRNANSSQQ